MPRVAAALGGSLQAGVFLFLLWPVESPHELAFVLLVSGWAFAEAGSQRSLDVAPTGGLNLLTSLATLLIFALCAAKQGEGWLGGFMLGFLGVMLRVWSIRTLGARFVSDVRCMRRESIARHGPYRWLRHPSEWGLLLITFGSCLLLGTWTSLLLWFVVLAPLVVLRSRFESQELASLLGQVRAVPS